uniref:B box-type domain-containing protein n=1 Tax=Branchiostoma floridae TaxID=7739 RepID=C3ZGA7_BRAFL|eukprot:XP_002592417.1 hypothetical protein BRAFLDRAFT_67283 [Branchiostoma floridae]
MAGQGSAFLQAIHEELTCSVCKEIFTVPKVLPCQHTFCQDCLQKALQAGELFTCLTCDTDVNLTPEKINDLPDDRAVLALCDRIHSHNKALPRVKQEPEDIEEGGQTFCKTHSSETLTLYCLQCKVPVCTACLDESHPGHRMVTFKKAVQDHRAAVKAFLKRGWKLVDKHCDFIKDLRTAEGTLQQQKHHISTSIADAYKKMLDKLMEMKDQMLEEVQEKHRQNMEAVARARTPVLAQLCQLVVTCSHVERTLAQQRAEFSVEENRLFQAVGNISEGLDLSLVDPKLVSLDAKVAQLLQYNSVYESLTPDDPRMT